MSLIYYHLKSLILKVFATITLCIYAENMLRLKIEKQLVDTN